MPSLGIGIITFNRRDVVADTIDRVRSLTRQSDTLLLVADDGSHDGTRAMLRDRNVAVVTGDNTGVAWNKNRALFLLAQVLNCETVILLEDDAYPEAAGWEADWMEAARSWGHANYAGAWTHDHGLPGSGTIDDPVLSALLTAQCACFSRDALSYCGYFDPRFRGYGHEHVEHTIRLSRAGYGAVTRTTGDGHREFLHMLIRGGIAEKPAPTYFNQEQSDRNEALALSLLDKQTYSAPWNNIADLHRFRNEMQAALAAGPDRFMLRRQNRQAFVTAPPGALPFDRSQAATGAMPSAGRGPTDDAPPGAASAPPPWPKAGVASAGAPRVLRRAGASRNLALGCPTLQSSLSRWSNAGSPEADSAGAVNGRFDQVYGFHTDEEDAPWWQVDLRQACMIHSIIVYNRFDHPVIAQRAFPLSIQFSADRTTWTLAHTAPADEDAGGLDNRPLIWRPSKPVVARHVRLQVARRSMLHLVQVEVFGTAAAVPADA